METQVLYGLKAAQTSLNGFKPNQQLENGALGKRSHLFPCPFAFPGHWCLPNPLETQVWGLIWRNYLLFLHLLNF